ncbi:MAG: hypothetical protein M3P06_08580 [Acidobacteriota bacterium]|nr:hypothetical protein [Acidobacteriota bacterium]
MHPRLPPRFLILAIVLLVAAPVLAAPYDMVAVGNNVGGCFFLPFSITRIEWLNHWTEEPTNIHTVAAAPGGRVYAAVAGPRIEIVELKADQSRTAFFSGADGYKAASLAVDSALNIHVLAQTGATAAIISISSSGALTAIHPLGFEIDDRDDAFDLAADQCTVVIGAGSAIRRFNVCTGTALPDLASIYATDLAFLPSGEVLVANDTGLHRYDSLSVLLGTIVLDDYPNTITLRNEGTRVLVETGCESGRLHNVDLNTGAIADAGGTFVTQPRVILVPDGWTAAFGAPASHAPVPTLSTWITIAFATLLALTALHRMS